MRLDAKKPHGLLVETGDDLDLATERLNVPAECRQAVVLAPLDPGKLGWPMSIALAISFWVFPIALRNEVESEADAMAALQAAEVDRRLRFPDEFRHSRHGAFLDGFSLHAGVRIHGNDRDGRDRLCRYLLRPPLSLQRLSQGEEAGLSTG